MDRAGYFSLGRPAPIRSPPSSGRNGSSSRSIGLPRTFGAGLRVSDVHAIVEGDGMVPTLAHGDGTG